MSGASPQTARIFIGIWPDPKAARALAQLDPWLESLSAYRLTPTEQRHMTVAFLGETPREAIEPLCEAVAETCAAIPPFEAEFAGVTLLPRPNRPRVIAAALAGESGLISLTELVRDAAALAAPTDDLARDLDRPPKPHVTLARLRRSGRPGRIDPEQAPDLSGGLSVGAVRVVESTLGRQCPIYRVLAEAGLGSRT